MEKVIEYPQVINVEIPKNYKYKLKDINGRLELTIYNDRGNKLIVTNYSIILERPTKTLRSIAEQFRLPVTITLGYFTKR